MGDIILVVRPLQDTLVPVNQAKSISAAKMSTQMDWAKYLTTGVGPARPVWIGGNWKCMNRHGNITS